MNANTTAEEKRQAAETQAALEKSKAQQALDAQKREKEQKEAAIIAQ